jgi:RNA polymerase sigma factor (sigma-70 family)
MVRRAFRGAFSDDEIDDIYAGAWVGVLRALETRHGGLTDDEVRSYVLTAVAHQAGKELRRRRRKPTAPLELVGSVPDGGEGPDERLAGAEQSRVARDLLASLPPRRRAVMLLRYGWGLEPRQVCELLTDLSPRAYRKEITRGVDELTEKMRSFERGDWCADREPVLKAYAAGLADEDERRQARAHLSHCRECSTFVARLGGHLHDLGSGLVFSIALEGLDHATLADRLAELGGRAKDGVVDLMGRSQGIDEAAQTTATTGAKGAGAAGAGALAKLAGLGLGGKFALACMGGVAATACVAAGVVPLLANSPQAKSMATRPSHVAGKAHSPDTVVAVPSPAAPPIYSPPSADQGQATSRAQPRNSVSPSDPTQPTEPVAPDTPPVEQEFGVATAATAAPTESSSPAESSGGGAGNGSAAAVRQEFGP